MRDRAALLREFFERVWNTGDLDAVARFVAPAYTIHSDPGDPWDGQTLDLDGFRHRLSVSRSPFPDLTFTLGEMVAEGDRVAVSRRMRGTHTGPLGTLPPTGLTIDVAGLTIYSFEGDRVSGHRQVVDRLAVLRQLGLLGGG